MKIGIIGGGFAGIMTAIHCIEKFDETIEIIIVNDKKESFAKGVAYDSYSRKHLLNVIAGKMSAFPDQPDHFTNWVMERTNYHNYDRELISNAFLSRSLYGEYLEFNWLSAKELATKKNIKLVEICSKVLDLEKKEQTFELVIEGGDKLLVDFCVLATGNHEPRDPSIVDQSILQSKRYYKNPWKLEGTESLNNNESILILGNGLTMVDTVTSLKDANFRGLIYTVSPNGFSILPHRNGQLKYSKLLDELEEGASINELVRLVNRHVKLVRQFGVSAEPIIDSMRPKTQNIWRNFSTEEKNKFMGRIRHLWGVARHRIPLQMHDRIQQMRIDGQLHVLAGRLVNVAELENSLEVDILLSKLKGNKKIQVTRMINCTGPETDFSRLGEGALLKNCLEKGIIIQDHLKLGIVTNPETFQVFDGYSGQVHPNLFTLGANLKGELWESTAVNEIRNQAELLTNSLGTLIHKINTKA